MHKENGVCTRDEISSRPVSPSYMAMAPNADQRKCMAAGLSTAACIPVHSLALVKAAQLKKWCSSLPGLNAAQINMCRNTRLMYPAIRSGLENAVKICEGEFRNERWNCAMLGSHNLLKRAPGE